MPPKKLFALDRRFFVSAVLASAFLLGVPGLTAAQGSAELRILAPQEGSLLRDGNLFLIEGIARNIRGGPPDRVEVSFDFDRDWEAAERTPEDPLRWRFLWEDPDPSMHRVRVRALGMGDGAVHEQSILVEVEDDWTSSFAIDNPYAVPGHFRKGQTHVHSRSSFDAWNSLSPVDLAREYQRLGYSFIAVTDHDVITNPVEAEDDRFVVIAAYESTSESGHISGLFVSQTVDPELAPQERLDHITAQGGMAILNHPGWRVGWSGADFGTLKGYVGFEIYNGVTSTTRRAERSVALWHEVLNAKGWANRVFAVAVDDAHDPEAMDRGWTQVKVPRLTEQAIRNALENGAFYASNGPTFSVLGVREGTLTAASPDAVTIRFIDQDLNVLSEGPPRLASYRPTGKERWVRIEAVAAEGQTAWSQPFWLFPTG